MQLFYCPGILKNEYFLQDDESRHCAKVLRKNVGDTINLLDGQGTIYEALLTEVSPRKCQFDIVKKLYQEKPEYYIHIAIAPTKNMDRTEWFVEKAVEIGIDEITFLHTEHSERNKINGERLRKKAMSAMKQSMRAYLPEIHDMQKLARFLRLNFHGQRFVAHLDGNRTDYLSQAALRSNRYLVLIGPEGGFSQEEIDLINNIGFKSVKFGDHRLRTETAGIMACSILNMINLS